MKIWVKLSNQTSISVICEGSQKVSSIIELISESEFKLPNIELEFNEKKLDENYSLAKYNIKEDSILICKNKIYHKSFFLNKDCQLKYGDLLNDIKSGNIINTKYIIFNSFDYFSVTDHDKINTIYFFKKPIKVKILNSSNKEIVSEMENIVSINEIRNKCVEKNLNEPYRIINQSKVYLNSLDFLLNIKEDLNVFVDETIKIININSTNKPTILQSETFEPKNLSNYFFDIFKYNKNDGSYFSFNKDIGKRINLIGKLDKLIRDEMLKLFKFTGPSSIGKSTTLIVWSRLNYNILYLHLKYLQNLGGGGKESEVFDYIISECKRLYFQEDSDKQKVKLENFLRSLVNIDYLSLIQNLINYLKNNFKQTICIILDQVKEKNCPKIFLENVIENIKKSANIKLVICSSLNCKDIQDKLIDTLLSFNIAKMEYNITTQDYYFYISDLYKVNYLPQINNKLESILKLFNYKAKYQYIFEKTVDCEKEIEEAKKHIKEKIKEFIEEKKLDVSVCDILLYTKQYIGKNINFEGNVNILNKIPLKYFILTISDKNILLDYDFPFIKYIIDNIISIEDAEKYFQLKKYQHIDFLKGKVKDDYFEFSCKYYIINNHFLGGNDYKEYNFKSISSFDEIEENDVIKAIKEFKKNEIIISKENYNLNENYNTKTTKKQEEKSILNNNDIKDSNNIKNRIKSFKFMNDINFSIESFMNENIKFKSEPIKGCDNLDIYLEQSSQIGKCLDLGFLTGSKDYKKFLGIQIKCYSPGTIGGNLYKENKETIKQKIKNVISGSRYFFGCSIIEWHYLVILYLNEDDSEVDSNSFLIKTCNHNLFDYIFYNPITHIFKDKNKNTIYNYKIGKYSNLDNNSIIFENPKKDFQNFQNTYLLKKREKAENMNEKYYNDYFDFIKEYNPNINENIEEESLIKLMDNIINNLKKSLNKSLVFKCKYDLDSSIPFPGKNVVFLYRTKDNEFIYIIADKEGKYQGYKMNNKFNILKIIESLNIYSEIGINYKYFYSFDVKTMFISTKNL